MAAILVSRAVGAPPFLSHHDTPAKAARQAHRWLRRRIAVAGEWATILDPATGALLKRYELRNGSVTRMQ